MRDVAEQDIKASTVIPAARRLALQMQLRAQLGLALLVFLASCTVGPDFKVPNPPDVQSLTPRPLPDRVVADGEAQRFAHGHDLPGNWWTLFRSRALTELMERALRNNHDLKAAQATLRVARANYEAQQGALFPVVSVSEVSSRQKVATADLSAPTVSGSPYFTLHTAQLTISYVPDVFGGVRRQVEAASAQAESQSFQLEATYLTLTSNIALAAIQEASLNEQVRETKLAIAAEQTLAEGEQYAASFESASARDWAALRAAIYQAKQTIPLLNKQLAMQRDLVTALTGQFAGADLPVHFSTLRLPRDLPVVLPSQLVEQRPDVRAAQANLHAAGALVGVAIANRIPLFNIAGNIGRTSSQFSNLGSPAPQFLFWTVAGSVTQTIFDGFTLAQRQRAAEAGWAQAAEQYQSTVVIAFQNVADALQAIELDGSSARDAIAATTAAQENLCLTVAGFAGYDGRDEPRNADLKHVKTNDRALKDAIGQRFGEWWESVCKPDADIREKLRNEATDAGGSAPSGIDVVTSEQLYLATRLSLVTARAARYTDVVALFQALGGGWWNRADVEDPGASALVAGTRAASDNDRTANEH
jgi:NodT family efflux transporter outer membrane factor (OMF) lipoprotein